VTLEADCGSFGDWESDPAFVIMASAFEMHTGARLTLLLHHYLITALKLKLY
jgi:hypothetical protein